MLFMSLLIYLVLWFPYYRFASDIFPFSAVSVWFSPPLLYLLSILLAILILYIVHSLQPEAKLFFRNLVRIRSVGWIAFLTCPMAIISLVTVTMIKGPDPFTFGILLPVAVISLLNALRIEIFPRTLRPEEVTPEVITIPGGPGIPVPSGVPDVPETPGPSKPPEQPGEPEPVPGTPEVPEIPGDIVKEFKWEHKGQSYEVKLAIRHSIYDNFKSRERVLHGSEWAREYAAGGICAEIRELVHSLLLTGKPYGTYEEVEFILSFVQHVINYESEEGEYPKYPVETLVEEAGDCEDFSILGASILKVMGYDAALLFLPGHAALGIAGATGIPGSYAEHQGRRYYYCEMTAAGWRIGQLPEGYEDVQIEVRPIPGIIIDTDLPEE